MKKRFNTTDECKPVHGGHGILITSSGGAAALIERATGNVVFYAHVPNAHSADLLPNNRVAVAASHAPDGDRLILYDIGNPDQELYSDELSWGHGVVWDEARQILWALSDTEIRSYRLESWDTSEPSLSRISTIELPDVSGHDMLPVAGTAYLSISTWKHCWLFDRDQSEFTLHPQLANEVDVKSIAVNPVTNQLAYVRADEGHWWSETVRLLDPDVNLHFPGEHIYKARWSGV